MSSGEGKVVFLGKNCNGPYEVHDPRGLGAFGVDDGDNRVTVQMKRMLNQKAFQVRFCLKCV